MLVDSTFYRHVQQTLGQVVNKEIFTEDMYTLLRKRYKIFPFFSICLRATQRV